MKKKKTAKKPAQKPKSKPTTKVKKVTASPIRAKKIEKVNVDTQSIVSGVDHDDIEEFSAEAGKPPQPGAPVDSSSSLKNFRHHPDMENFYRFIYENDLRFEALSIINGIMVGKHAKKKGEKESSAKATDVQKQ